MDTGLITSGITRGVSFATFTSGVGLPSGIALSGTRLLFSLATAITRKRKEKLEKQDAITLLA